MEIRVGDGASNPYLVIAAVLFAGLDGVRRGLDPGEPLSGDAYTLPEAGQGDAAAASRSGTRSTPSRATR